VQQNKFFSAELFEDIDINALRNDYFRPVLLHVSRLLSFRDLKVVDIGCGTGVHSRVLAELGCTQLFGVDIISSHSQRATENGFREVRPVKDLSEDSLPFQDNEIDFALCKDVLEHLLNPENVIGECARVLSKNGYLLIHVPNHFPVFARLKFLFTGNIDTYHFFPNASRINFPHIRFFIYQEMIDSLKQFGFKPILNLSEHFPAIPILNRLPIASNLLRTLSNAYPDNFAGAITILCQKE
jgi:SAM-dependent methyltransferase